ncbi:MAG: ribonuclease Y [bacterium]
MAKIKTEIVYLLLSFAWGIICLCVGFIVRRYIVESKLVNSEAMARKIIEEASKEAETMKKEASLKVKDLQYQLKYDFEKETKIKREELQGIEKRLSQKEENLERKFDLLDKKERDVSYREKNIEEREGRAKEKEEKYSILIEEQRRQLEKISGFTSEEPKKILMGKMEDEARHEAAKTIKRLEEEAKENGARKAKEIIGLAIQKCAVDHVTESTVAVVDLPNNEMKGRIIGREGRNIRALEVATGVDLIIDDTPEAVILSGYDPIRREVAKLSLERLITDGRIHPTRIEEIVEKVKRDLDVTIREEGEKTALEVGVHGLHLEEIKLIGRLKYRTSYAQNVLQHSKEVAYLAGTMAAELGVDIQIAKRAGLLHDIGKAIDREVEGAHAKIGADLARKYNESAAVIHAIAAHHEEEEPKTVEAVLVQAADAISASRLGARRESLDSYVKRLEKLEKVANSFEGVEKSYAIQAGREIRIMIEHDENNSVIDVAQIARDVARKIEQELEYPGQIKVTAIKEIRAIEYAK